MPERVGKMRKCPYCHRRRRDGEKCCNSAYKMTLEEKLDILYRLKQQVRGAMQ